MACSFVGQSHVLLPLVQDYFGCVCLQVGFLVEMTTHLVRVEFLAPLSLQRVESDQENALNAHRLRASRFRWAGTPTLH